MYGYVRDILFPVAVNTSNLSLIYNNLKVCGVPILSMVIGEKPDSRILDIPLQLTNTLGMNGGWGNCHDLEFVWFYASSFF